MAHSEIAVLRDRPQLCCLLIPSATSVMSGEAFVTICTAVTKYLQNQLKGRKIYFGSVWGARNWHDPRAGTVVDSSVMSEAWAAASYMTLTKKQIA